jgi:hypothetical protein
LKGKVLSYHVALVKGTDVDKPRNLAKSVTIDPWVPWVVLWQDHFPVFHAQGSCVPEPVAV